MSTKSRLTAAVICLCISVASALAAAGPATAKSAEPTVTSLAWYWEEASTQEVTLPDGSKVTVETPNPFCPGAGSGTGNPSATCAEQRLPLEIDEGDYETPNKLPAVGFDLTLVPVGSDVSKFTVTLREAKTGCYERDGKADDDPQDNYCEETDPQNLGDHKLQACKVQSFFGDGEARQYKEVPKYSCSKSDPIAKRKQVKAKDGEGSDFYWTFDLTSFAKEWVKSFSATTGFVITGVPASKDDNSSWRVVLAGPKFQNGVTSDIDFTEPDIPPIAPPGGTTGTGSVTTTTGTGGFDTGTGGFDTGSGGTGSFGTGPTGTGAAPSPAPTDAVALPPNETASAQGMPGYVWLAILAGLIGFFLVRSVVLESKAGIRPNGVLATIHGMNANRKGVPQAAPTEGATSSFVGGMKAVGGRLKSSLGKLNFRKKG